ncbi:MAG: hypothetical protein VB135_00415 [Burkholderia sp.]
MPAKMRFASQVLEDLHRAGIETQGSGEAACFLIPALRRAGSDRNAQSAVVRKLAEQGRLLGVRLRATAVFNVDRAVALLAQSVNIEDAQAVAASVLPVE